MITRSPSSVGAHILFHPQPTTVYNPRENHQYNRDMLEFTVNNFFDSTGISSYEYRIEGHGFDKQWHSIGSKNYVNVKANLAESNYLICGRISNQNGVYSNSVCTTAIVSATVPRKTG